MLITGGNLLSCESQGKEQELREGQGDNLQGHFLVVWPWGERNLWEPRLLSGEMPI